MNRNTQSTPRQRHIAPAQPQTTARTVSISPLALLGFIAIALAALFIVAALAVVFGGRS